jgi:hypothetical protein
MEDRRPLAPDEEERGEEGQSSAQLASSLEGEDLPEVHLHLGGDGDYDEGDGHNGHKWQHDRQSTEPPTSSEQQRSPLDELEGDDGFGDDDDELVFEGNKLGDAKGGRKLSNLQLCGLALYWFARSAWWAAFTIILLPLQVRACASFSERALEADGLRACAVCACAVCACACRCWQS